VDIYRRRAPPPTRHQPLAPLHYLGVLMAAAVESALAERGVAGATVAFPKKNITGISQLPIPIRQIGSLVQKRLSGVLKNKSSTRSWVLVNLKMGVGEKRQRA